MSGDIMTVPKKTEPGVYVIELETIIDGQKLRRRYEGPSEAAVISLAERAGELFGPLTVSAPNIPDEYLRQDHDR